MRQFIGFLFLVLFVSKFMGVGAQNLKPIVYLIPGQGSDSRLYKNIKIDSVFDVSHITYFIPEKDWSLNDFAKELAKQIDTTRQFFIVGVSLGGMLATEMHDFLNAEKVILISSAKSRKEFPFRYRFQKAIPIYKIVPNGVVKLGAKLLQPIVEPDRRYDKETFNAMLNDKDKVFLKRTSRMILEWDRLEFCDDIIHIHGDNDHTLPSRNVNFDYMVKDGSHMMVLTKGAVVSKLVNKELRNKY